MPKLAHGVVTALVTPFQTDERIDYSAWQSIIDFQIASGVDGLLATGGQGEFFSLSEEERIVALRFCRQAVAGRVPLYGNIGCISTRDTIRLAQKAEEEKIDCVVAITPWYLKPSPAELTDHYIEVCKAVRLPVMAYSIPERTGVELTAAVLERISGECENFIGIKDSSGNLEQLSEIVALNGKRAFHVMIGRDHLIVPAMRLGCTGAVTACANVAPAAFVQLYRACIDGRPEEADRVQRLLEPLRAAFSLHTFPSVIKEAMSMIGLSAGPCRRPVGRMPMEARAKLEMVIHDLEREGLLPHASTALAAL